MMELCISAELSYGAWPPEFSHGTEWSCAFGWIRASLQSNDFAGLFGGAGLHIELVNVPRPPDGAALSGGVDNFLIKLAKCLAELSWHFGVVEKGYPREVLT